MLYIYYITDDENDENDENDEQYLLYEIYYKSIYHIVKSNISNIDKLNILILINNYASNNISFDYLLNNLKKYDVELVDYNNIEYNYLTDKYVYFINNYIDLKSRFSYLYTKQSIIENTIEYIIKCKNRKLLNMYITKLEYTDEILIFDVLFSVAYNTFNYFEYLGKIKYTKNVKRLLFKKQFYYISQNYIFDNNKPANWMNYINNRLMRYYLTKYTYLLYK